MGFYEFQVLEFSQGRDIYRCTRNRHISSRGNPPERSIRLCACAHFTQRIYITNVWTRNLGAIIRDGDHKRAQFLVLGLSLWYGTIFSIFRASCAIACGTLANMLRGFFGEDARAKWPLKLPDFFICFVQTSIRLCLLEFCLRSFVLSCSNFTGVRPCRI